MTFIIHYLHPASTAASVPAGVPIGGLFREAADAHRHGLMVATSHQHFVSWCAGFEIEDADGALVSKWVKPSHG